MTYVELSQAEADLERLVDKASSGEEVVITRDGKPVARLVAPLEDFREYEGEAHRYPLRGLPVTLVDPTAPINEAD